MDVTKPFPSRGAHGNLEGDTAHWRQRTQHHMNLGDASLERSQAFHAPETATPARDELQQGFSDSLDHEGVVSALDRLEMLLGRHAESLLPLFLAVELNPWGIENHNRLADAFEPAQGWRSSSTPANGPPSARNRTQFEIRNRNSIRTVASCINQT